MAELGEATLAIGIKSVNLDREQAARAEAILIADFALRTKDGGRPLTANGSKPAAAIDLMTVADYIVAGFAEEDPGPYEFVFTSEQPEPEGSPLVLEDGRPDDEREDDEF